MHVGGKPVMSYILDDLKELGVTELVLIVGYLQDTVREYIATEYPDLKADYVVQEVPDGTAGAVKLTEPFIDEELLIVFVDTLFDADLNLARTLPDEWAGVIWAKEVEDYQRFGVIVTDDEGAMTRIVEKPSEPISKLANIGLYFIRDHALLFEGIDHVLSVDPGPSGEYYLTDAFQYMVDHGARIRTAPVEGWYDCGKPNAVLDTNRHLLETTRGGVADDASVEGSDLDPATRVESGAVVVDSTLGPNVTVEAGASIRNSTLRDTIVGAGAQLEGVSLHDSLVGAHAQLSGVTGSVSVSDHSVIEGE
jgi:glucose-1-phosphate thymidylyltransferase